MHHFLTRMYHISNSSFAITLALREYLLGGMGTYETKPASALQLDNNNEKDIRI